MTIDTTRPRVFLPAPPLDQLPFGLLSVAAESTPADPHAQLGVQIETLSGTTGALAGLDNHGALVGTLAATEDFSGNTPAGSIPTLYTNPFLIYAGVSAHPVGHTPAELQDRATAKLALNAGRLIERALWRGTPSTEGNLNGTSSRTVTDGVLNSTTTVTSASAAFTAADKGAPITGTGIPANATISSVTNATTVVISSAATATASGVSITINRIAATDLTPVPGTPTTINIGMGLLEKWIGDNVGAQGMLHASRNLAGSLWNQVHQAGSKMLTLLGTPAAFGAGYDGSGPLNAAPAAGTTWLYATGPVSVIRSEVGLTHISAAQATSFATQVPTTTVFATEIVSVAYETGVAAVLVNL